ncbi:MULTISPECIES: glycoside hydrolase family 43 protein [unclassified Sphingomonas]|uniref:glycoside hydrolase family 43 protein n=1 Tax=unclassified Sphingomonas TaxID=196159 RepID=UPI00226A22FB|nr:MULTISPECIES: glycoside hydrolase family 43 protein [unclassified Sphingomonas]
MNIRRRLAALLIAPALFGAAAPPAPPAAPVQVAWFRYTGDDATLARAGQGNYANPILPGFYPDPSIIRVGAWFYLVNSTFAYFPGLPVFRSRDLVHWTQIGNAIDRPEQLDLTGRGVSEGLFAPALHHAGDRFYIINTCVGCGGTFIVTAHDPAGRWSDPVWIRDVGGIDPSLFTDEDGTTWLVNNDAPAGKLLYEGHRAIWIRRFDLATMKTVGPARVIVDGGVDIATKPAWTEGPHLFRHDGHYYLMTAEGGTSVNHSETVYRADRPDGPFVPLHRPILTQRDLPADRPNPIGSAGHAQLVDTPSGDWWAVFLATRPYAGDFYNTGRETFLLRARWQDGWPIITRPGETIPYAAPAPALPRGAPGPFPISGNFTLRDDFHAATLAPYWLTVRTPHERWWRTGADGLALTPRPDRIGERGQPSFLGRRQQHRHAEASAEIRADVLAPGGKAGLVAYQNEAHYYLIALMQDRGMRRIRVERRAGEGDPVDGMVLASAPLPAGAGTGRAPLRLRIVADDGRYAFDYAVKGGGWTRLLANADGTVLSTAKAGGFVGTTMGPYAYTP